MAYGDALGITLPTVGSTVGPTYAGNTTPGINAAIQALIDRLETKVTEAGILIGAALEMNSNDLTEVNAIQVDNLGAPLSGAPNARKMHMSGGEWYLTDNAGNAVQITSGGTLNAASIGGIGGDYGGADPALVAYVDASNLYTFTSDPGVFSRIQVAAVRFDTGSAGIIELEAPAAGTLTPNVQLPSAYGSTDDNNLVVNGTTGVAVFEDPALTGHGNKTIIIPAAAMAGDDNSAFGLRVANGTAWQNVGADSVQVEAPISGYLRAGDRIQSVTCYIRDGAGGGGNELSMVLREATVPGITASDISDIVTTDSGAAQDETHPLTTISFNGATQVLESLKQYWVKFSSPNTVDNLRVYAVQVVYDRP